MFASVLSAAILGMEVHPIHVEADVSDGLPSFTMVGFPSAQVKEAQDRVRTALKNNGIALPPKRITVNFAPADIKKEGAGFDLPLAAAVLAASGILKPEQLQKVMMAGEISLNGNIHAISGILPMIIRAREEKCRFCVVPAENLREARLIPDMKVIGVKDLNEMIQYLRKPESYHIEEAEILLAENKEKADFCEIKGQESLRRAVEIAVSGFHNLLMIGPPGAGCQADPGDHAASDTGGGTGIDKNLQHCRTFAGRRSSGAKPAVPEPAPYLLCTGTGRRRAKSETGGSYTGTQRRAFPG